MNNFNTFQVKNTDLLDFEPPPPSLNFNDDVLVRAMRQNLSIWKSHSDTSGGRRKSRKPRRRHYSTDTPSEDEEEVLENGNGSDADDDDDDYEPPIHTKVTPWSGNF